jgi:flagellar biosynthesis protein FlhB
MSDRTEALTEKKRESLRAAGIFPYSLLAVRCSVFGILLCLIPEAFSQWKSIFALTPWSPKFDEHESLLLFPWQLLYEYALPLFLFPILLAFLGTLLAGFSGGRASFQVTNLAPDFARLLPSGRKSHVAKPFFVRSFFCFAKVLLLCVLAVLLWIAVFTLCTNFLFSSPYGQSPIAGNALAYCFRLIGSGAIFLGILLTIFEFLHFRRRHRMTKAELEAELREEH